ncbi:hypothetical protein CYMTET_48832 [Cymbomonas tetramitiformis]|uniref:Glycosyltransferase n=1 Tax=Cymbomonas tetramitiformis TaxID=36881 RepID=A0AAE0EV56_9CHLO|nr:hypothetical protein CYMTET_48832 [Cymbomonas tetramitiformis]
MQQLKIGFRGRGLPRREIIHQSSQRFGRSSPSFKRSCTCASTSTDASREHAATSDLPRSVLVIGKVWPERSSSAAGVRTADLVSAFQRGGAKVSYACAARTNTYSDQLRDAAVSVYTCPMNRQQAFAAMLKEVDPDVCIFDRFTTEEQFGFMVKQLSPRTLRVLDTQDLHCLRDARQQLIKDGGSITDAMEVVPDTSSTMLLRELAAIFRSDLSLVVSPYEQQLLVHQYHVPSTKVALSRWYYPEPIPLEECPSFHQRRHFVTIGNFRHAPNMDSVEWLAQEVWDKVAVELPEAEMHIYGAYPPKRAMQLHNPKRRLHVLGRAPSLDLLYDHRVLFSPLRYGAGVKGKVVDAWWHGLPVVTTLIGSEGMEWAGEGSWGGLGGAVDSSTVVSDAVRMYRDEQLWEASQLRGRELTGELFARTRNERELLAVVDEALALREERRGEDAQGCMLWHHSNRSTEFFSRWVELKESLIEKDIVDAAAAGEAGAPSSTESPLQAVTAAVPKEGRRALSAGARATEVQREQQQAGAFAALLSASGLPASQVQALQEYAENIHQVAGFFEAALLPLYAHVHALQLADEIRGNVGEIGVYRGRSFIPLCLLLTETEVAVAIDCFENQEANPDGSGVGVRAEFDVNVDRFASLPPESLRVLQGTCPLSG